MSGPLFVKLMGEKDQQKMIEYATFEEINFTKLKMTIAEYVNLSKFELFWEDAEGDLLELDTKEDLSTALNYIQFKPEDPKVLKIQIDK